MIQAHLTSNGVKTTVRELMHFGLWGKYCRIMQVTDGYENPDEEIFLPDELMELMEI
jgi:hypothetical protein